MRRRTRRRLRKTAWMVLGGLTGGFVLAVLGFRIPPPAQPAPAGIRKAGGGNAGSLSIPASLPAPVQRFFRAIAGARVPVMHTAVVWGNQRVRRFGLNLPILFRDYFIPGRSMYRDLQMTWFGRPVRRGDAFYLSGAGAFRLGGVVRDGVAEAQSAQQTLWMESPWMPAVWLSDSRLRWQPLSPHSARLIAPPGRPSDIFILHFDPHSGLLREMDTQREHRGRMRPLRLRFSDWKRFQGVRLPTRIAWYWGKAAAPWVTADLRGAAYNIDVSAQIGNPPPAGPP